MKVKEVNFICFDKLYPINLSIFNEHSKFFLINKEFNVKKQNICLLSEFDNCTSHTKESVEAFLDYCQSRKITLNVSNAVPLKELSEKYLVTVLQKKADYFIEKYYKKVIEHFLSTKEAQSPIYEEILSKHLDEYSKDDRLFSKRIPTIYRIEQYFLHHIKKDEFKSDLRQMEIFNRAITLLFIIMSFY